MMKTLLKLGSVMMTNLVVWIVITLLSIMSFTNNLSYPSIETVVGICLLPVNAMINPLMYRPRTPEGLKIFCVEMADSMKKGMAAVKRRIVNYIRMNI